MSENRSYLVSRIRSLVALLYSEQVDSVSQISVLEKLQKKLLQSKMGLEIIIAYLQGLM